MIVAGDGIKLFCRQIFADSIDIFIKNKTVFVVIMTILHGVADVFGNIGRRVELVIMDGCILEDHIYGILFR